VLVLNQQLDVFNAPLLVLVAVMFIRAQLGAVVLVSFRNVERLPVSFVPDAAADAVMNPLLGFAAVVRLHMHVLTRLCMQSEVVQRRANVSLLIRVPELVLRCRRVLGPHDDWSSWRRTTSFHVQHFAVQLTHNVKVLPTNNNFPVIINYLNEMEKTATR
jgi:hypothetical protein